MMTRFPLAVRTLSIMLALSACASGKGELEGDDVGGDGGVVITDARLISDVLTWTCQEGDGGALYQGVFGQVVTLEHAPDSLRSLELPDKGDCTYGLDMFPANAGALATDIADLTGNPTWETDSVSGTLSHQGAGYYRDDVFPSARTCQEVSEVAGGGIRLTNAGGFTGAASPEPEEVPEVAFDGLSEDPTTGAEYLAWGTELVTSWGEHDWEEVWVQIRREREGEAWESVTCNATGMDSLTLDDQVWDLMDESLEVDQNNVYVAFQSSNKKTMDDRSTIQATTRTLAVAVVND